MSKHPIVVMHRSIALVCLIWTACLTGMYSAAATDDEKRKDAPTYSGSVAQILHERCCRCHRPGQSGPFSLLEYKQVVEHSQTIAAVIANGYMPPWKPVHHGIEFANNRKLSDRERETILNWIEAKCPVGDAGQLPAPPKYVGDWSLGTPDLIVRLDRPFPIPADGPDLYRSFAFPVGLPEDKWIKAIEVRPTARGVVHHALFFVDTDGNAKHQKSRDGLPGFVGMNFLRGRGNMLDRVPENMSRGLGGYVPGAMPNLLPGDLARLLPKGSDIVMQTHFHPSGKAENEQTELGIYFAKATPSQRLVSVQLPPLFGMGAGIDIPAGKSDFHIRDSYRLPVAIRGVEIGGHAHYLCTRLVMRAKRPDGQEVVLLEIDDWDLDWQDQYIFKTPIDLPAGTELSVDLWYDNSDKNPENPFHPPQRVAWGRESTDEMGSITLLAIAVNEAERESLEQDLQQRTRSGLASRIRSQLGVLGGFGGNMVLGERAIQLLDRNRNGNLEREELPARLSERLLDLFDDNGDELISPSEMELGRQNVKRFLDEDDALRKSLRERFRPSEKKSYSVPTFRGNQIIPQPMAQDKTTILVFGRSDCPIANSYQPKLKRIQQEFGDKDFDWVYIYSQRDATQEMLVQHAKEYGIEYRLSPDADLRVASHFGAKVSPQAVVVSKTGAVVYRGRIDDLYQDYGKKRSTVQEDDLRNALREIQQGKSVTVSETQPVGCKINFD
ncbi:MAG: redoxin family protein [Pirellula sp.]